MISEDFSIDQYFLDPVQDIDQDGTVDLDTLFLQHIDETVKVTEEEEDLVHIHRLHIDPAEKDERDYIVIPDVEGAYKNTRSDTDIAKDILRRLMGVVPVEEVKWCEKVTNRPFSQPDLDSHGTNFTPSQCAQILRLWREKNSNEVGDKELDEMINKVENDWDDKMSKRSDKLVRDEIRAKKLLDQERIEGDETESEEDILKFDLDQSPHHREFLLNRPSHEKLLFCKDVSVIPHLSASFLHQDARTTCFTPVLCDTGRAERERDGVPT